MAAKKNDAPSGPVGGKYDPDARYKVRLRRPHRRGSRTLSPLYDHVMTGRLLAEIPEEIIANVEPV